jgi:FMN phosphatase YigB (HAD superfamily)
MLSAVSSSDAPSEIFILVDVDNTLFDNDRFAVELSAHLETAFNVTERERYWSLHKKRWAATGISDYLGTMQEFRVGLQNDPALLQMSSFLLDFPFADLLYPQALDAVAHLRTLAPASALSDGDMVFQPRKVAHTGVFDAFDGNVLIYEHKQHQLDLLQQRYPARHYVMIDDKPNILADMKKALGERLTTVFVRQGQYAANASAELRAAPDIKIDRIGELLGFTLQDFALTSLAAASSAGHDAVH